MIGRKEWKEREIQFNEHIHSLKMMTARTSPGVQRLRLCAPPCVGREIRSLIRNPRCPAAWLKKRWLQRVYNGKKYSDKRPELNNWYNMITVYEKRLKWNTPKHKWFFVPSCFLLYAFLILFISLYGFIIKNYLENVRVARWTWKLMGLRDSLFSWGSVWQSLCPALGSSLMTAILVQPTSGSFSPGPPSGAGFLSLQLWPSPAHFTPPSSPTNGSLGGLWFSQVFSILFILWTQLVRVQPNPSWGGPPANRDSPFSVDFLLTLFSKVGLGQTCP